MPRVQILEASNNRIWRQKCGGYVLLCIYNRVEVCIFIHSISLKFSHSINEILSVLFIFSIFDRGEAT